MTDVMEEEIVTDEELAAQNTTPPAPDELVETYVRVVHNQTTGKIDNFDVTEEVKQTIADRKKFNEYLNVIIDQASASDLEVFVTFDELNSAEANGYIPIDTVGDGDMDGRFKLVRVLD